MVALLLIALIAVTQAATSRDVVSARLTQLPPDQPHGTIALQNSRDAALIAWAVRQAYEATHAKGFASAYLARTLPEFKRERDMLSRFGNRTGVIGPFENVEGVIATMQPSTPDTCRYRLENGSEKIIEAYEIAGQGGGVTSDSAGTGQGIRPGASAEVQVGCNTARDDNLRLQLIVFDDGTYEGSRQRFERVLKGREERALEYASAVAILRKAAARSPGDLIEFLRAEQRALARAVEATGRPYQPTHIDEFIRSASRSPQRFLELLPAMLEHHESVWRALVKSAPGAPR